MSPFKVDKILANLMSLLKMPGVTGIARKGDSFIVYVEDWKMGASIVSVFKKEEGIEIVFEEFKP